jgi:hypothetical protein
VQTSEVDREAAKVTETESLLTSCIVSVAVNETVIEFEIISLAPEFDTELVVKTAALSFNAMRRLPG